MSNEPDDKLNAALEAVANSKRRELLDRLRADGELSCGNLSDMFDVTPPAISRHIAVLELAWPGHQARGSAAAHGEHQRRRLRADPQMARCEVMSRVAITKGASMGKSSALFSMIEGMRQEIADVLRYGWNPTPGAPVVGRG